MRSFRFWLLFVGISLAALRIEASPKVALMDFSIDDNSYISAQAAANFTGLLQAKLAAIPGVEWVEREQLEKARQELELSAMDFMNNGASVRRGKWVKADWMITGHFSLDDRNRRTLALEITELQRADVLASKTITPPEEVSQQFQVTTNQVETAASAVIQLLSEARKRLQQTAGKIAVAPLFFAAASNIGFFKNVGALEQGFNDALERAVATNSHMRLVRFPRAYRSLDESEMVLDGLVESDRNAWKQTADLYVWGTYDIIRQRTRGKPPEQRLEILVHLWDGSSPPVVLKEELPCSLFGEIQGELAAAAMNRLASNVTIHAHRRTTPTDASAIRHEIAESIIKSHNTDSNAGLDDREQFLQAVHMLETACFFDPDNATARALYITLRWGWWMDFSFKVKNEFWSKWRRSEAWGRYVDRFGLNPVAVNLPFPYQQADGIAEAYLRSLDDVARMFPQWNSAEEMALEDKWRQQGVHTDLTEAELHGFPKEMPHDFAMKWKMEVQAEHGRRLSKVAEFIEHDWTTDGKTPPVILGAVFRGILLDNRPAAERLALVEKIWPRCVESAQKFGTVWIVGGGGLADEEKQLLIKLCAQAGKPEKGDQLLAMLSQNQAPSTPSAHTNAVVVKTAPQASSQMVPVPPWARDFHTLHSMFRLTPPNALPLEVQSAIQEIHFPKQFDVQTINRLDFLGDTLLILAMDERSQPSSDSRPDATTEILDSHKRLWTLKPGEEKPTLFEADLFPQSINDFLVKNGQLWFAGKTTGYLDLRTRQIRKFDLADGFDLATTEALALAGGNIFAAGDNFTLSMFDTARNRWSHLPLPSARLQSGPNSPPLLTGNTQQLSYAAGDLLIRDLNHKSWTNLTNVNFARSILADDSGLWYSDLTGLHFYDPAVNSSKNWTTPVILNGLLFTMTDVLMGGPERRKRDVDRMDDQVQNLMRRFQTDRKKWHASKPEGNRGSDPLHLDWRIPGEVTSLAQDGDFLWAGIGNFSGNYLLLLHPLTESAVAYWPVPGRGHISSLAISGDSVWIGIAFGDSTLLRISKNAFLSVPKNRWLSLAISPAERTRLVSTMGVRDQAMYAFYGGDDSRVAALLEGTDPNKAGLEELFLLAFCYDTLGLNKPQMACKWFEAITSRHPDTPWAKIARAALSENDHNYKVKEHDVELLAKYDLNHNGILDAAEIKNMQASPDYQREKQLLDNDQLDGQMNEVIKRFDRNNDGKLDVDELNSFRIDVVVISEAPAGALAGRKIVVTPFISKNFPSVSDMLKKYDSNRDSALDASELKKLAQDVRKK